LSFVIGDAVKAKPCGDKPDPLTGAIKEHKSTGIFKVIFGVEVVGAKDSADDYILRREVFFPYSP